METKIHALVLQSQTNAQVAELVDALVSNTNEETRAGSIPALGTGPENTFSGFFVLKKM